MGVHVRQIFIMIFFCALSAYTQTTLSGNIAGTTFERSGNPFMVTDNLTIPEGKSVTIKDGCIFLFKPFTGLHIEGSLRIEGGTQSPVIFSTVNDSKYNPQAEALPSPFDWNGIVISTTAKDVRLTNFIIAYAVYGIKSMKQDIAITNGIFNQIGQFPLTINEAIKPIVDGVPYNFGEKKVQNSNDASFVKQHLPTILGTSGIACGIGAGIAAIVFFKTRNDYLGEQDPYKLSSGRTSITNSLVATVIFGAATAVLVPAAIIVHNNRKSLNNTTTLEITPQFQNGPGIAVCVWF